MQTLDDYKLIKGYNIFQPKSIRAGIESYFSSHLYDYSIYSYFYNLNMFLNNSSNVKCNNIIPFKDKNLSEILQDKNICDNFYQKNNIIIAENTYNVLLELNPKLSEYFIEVTFPTLFGFFVSDDLCEKGNDFLNNFYQNEILLNRKEIFSSLVSKFIRSDMNFQFCMFDSFNSLYSIGASQKQEKFYSCLEKACQYSFSLLNSSRFHALQRLIDSKQDEIFNQVIKDIIIKEIKTWRFDSYYICSEDGNFRSFDSKYLNQISQSIKEIIRKDSDKMYQTNKIGSLFRDKKVLPIIITKLDLKLIDQIFNKANIQPIYYQNQSKLLFNIEEAFGFAVHHREFIESCEPFLYDLNPKEPQASPKVKNYLKFREECFSKSLDPIEEQLKIKEKLITEINQSQLTDLRKKNEIAQAENNFQFALNIEIKICNCNKSFQESFFAYSNRVFKSYMIGIKRALSQAINFRCTKLIDKIEITDNNNFEIQVKAIIFNEIKRFLVSVNPTSTVPIPDELVNKAAMFTNFKTDDFFIFIQSEFYKGINANEIIPIDVLMENRPLMNILTEFQQSLFLSFEEKFKFDEKIAEDPELKNIQKKDQENEPNISFIKLLISCAYSKMPNRARMFTFIEIHRFIKSCTDKNSIKQFILEYFPEINKDKLNRLRTLFFKSKKYYEIIKNTIPNNFASEFSEF